MRFLRDLQASIAPLVLVVAGLVATIASFADASLTAVSIAACATAVVSGAVVIRNATLVPRRLRAASSAVWEVCTHDGSRSGCAVFVGKGRWLTVGYLFDLADRPLQLRSPMGDPIDIRRISQLSSGITMLQTDSGPDSRVSVKRNSGVEPGSF